MITLKTDLFYLLSYIGYLLILFCTIYVIRILLLINKGKKTKKTIKTGLQVLNAEKELFKNPELQEQVKKDVKEWNKFKKKGR